MAVKGVRVQVLAHAMVIAAVEAVVVAGAAATEPGGGGGSLVRTKKGGLPPAASYCEGEVSSLVLDSSEPQTKKRLRGLGAVCRLHRRGIGFPKEKGFPGHPHVLHPRFRAVVMK